ncbi:uncharacterized protein LACBIDRAFT_294980 [Laccaria bicolor S238N-H82]|uniref:Predicted protein n=1 Tax=Laccaria bicolor (strain S238N-H82 / ATCC MYA-4686) TaxID=486041 RepID=B0DJX8_LACBS|nr:uncharacterized protein LACBIDRAFT_294980 [Laccaria bicolor S238N-H82]EDR05093.1 predicted protein [Laccaria bicolor S238N-H82]|eukprot:XP_001884483.1 predicted protein [Laccaria bicolor S238N-H82]
MLGSVFNRNQAATGVTCLLRSFQLSGKSHGFSEFQGPGPPAAELGSPGDIYIDTTEGKHALYARYPNKWKEWRKMRAGTIDTSSIPHPDFPNRILGIMVNSGNIGWFSKGKALGDTPYHSDGVLPPESPVSNPSEVIATILASGREVKKRKRGSTNDAMESAKRMRTTTRQDVVPRHESTDSCHPGPTDDGMNLPPSLQRRPLDTPVKLDLRSVSKRRPASGTNKMKISAMKPPPAILSLDDAIVIRQRFNSDSSSNQIDPHVQHRNFTSPSQFAPNTTPDHVTAQFESGSALPRFTVQPPTVLALSHTGEPFVVNVEALLAELMHLREENNELAKIKRDNALLVKLLASYPPSATTQDHHVPDAIFPTNDSCDEEAEDSLEEKTCEELQAEIAALKAKLLARKKGGNGKKTNIPEQGENDGERRLSPHPRDDNGEQVSGEDTLGEPSPSIAEDIPPEELDSFKGQEHDRLSSPTTVGFDESRESDHDQVDELEESGSETNDDEAADDEDDPASPRLSIPIEGDGNDTGNETIQRGEVDFPPNSPPSDLRNIDAEDAFDTGSPPPIDAPIGADVSDLNFDDPTEDANNFSNPSDRHNYSSPEPNMLVVKQEVVSPPSVRRTHPPPSFFPAEQEIIDLTLDNEDDDNDSVPHDPDVQELPSANLEPTFEDDADSVPDDLDVQEVPSATLEPSTPHSLFGSPTINLPNILQPLNSPSPNTRDIFDEIDAEWPTPPVKSKNHDVGEGDTTTQTSVEQDSTKSSAHAFDDPEKSHLLSTDDQSHRLDVKTPPSNTSTRHHTPRPGSPTMVQDIEVKEESALLENELLEDADANWLTTTHLQVVFDEKCVPNAFLCRLCLASEPTKIFKRGSGTSRSELRKHCADEHWDACGTLRNLEHDQLLHIFDNLSAENNSSTGGDT